VQPEVVNYCNKKKTPNNFMIFVVTEIVKKIGMLTMLYHGVILTPLILNTIGI